MKTKQIMLAALIGLLSVLLTGCGGQYNRNWMATGQTLHEGRYMVVGRVTSMQAVPVDQAGIFLIRSFYRGGAADGDVLPPVVGRVTDKQVLPANHSGVFPIREYTSSQLVDGERSHTRLTDQDTLHLLAVTNPSGEFTFTFELAAGDDIWLYIDAPGFQPRFINLNRQLGNSPFDAPGYSPISVHAILDPKSMVR